MKPQTRWHRDLLTGVGIPRSGFIVRSDMGQTVAGVDAEHWDALSEAADGLVRAEPRIGVAIWTRACGCISKTWVTDSPRYAGRVTRADQDLPDVGTDHEQGCPRKVRVVIHESDDCRGGVIGWSCETCEDDDCEHECHIEEATA